MFFQYLCKQRLFLLEKEIKIQHLRKGITFLRFSGYNYYSSSE